ncbi:hypothetical protein GGH96_001585 [Coemansia sp. RSA 1972]|nr:hypothetical protein GGH96_001585 [Coemansia sp. RSA 1972]
MVTAYTNNDMQRFGEPWRCAINLKFDSKEEKEKLEQQLRDIKTPEPEIQQQVQMQIQTAAHHAKEVLDSHRPVATMDKEHEIINFLSLTGDRREATSSDESAASSVELATLPDEPVASSSEPAASSVEPAALANSKLKSFKDHLHHKFDGYVMTDGISILVIRKNKEILAAKAAKAASQKRKREELAQEQPPVQLQYQQPAPSYWPAVLSSQLMSMMSQLPPMPSQNMSMSSQYVRPPLQQTAPSYQPVQQAQGAWQARQARLSAEQQPPQQPAQQERPPAKKAQPHCPAQLQQKADCQYIDDLSQATLQSMAGWCVLCLYRYTRNQQRKETRLTKFQQILEKVKPDEVAKAEQSLGAGSCIKPDLESYKVYLEARAKVANQLTWFYNKTYTVHLTSTHQIHQHKPKSEVRAFPLHRKLRLSAYVNRKQADQRLGKKLQKEFGLNAVIVIGDWSAPMAQFHEPIRGKSWWMLLKRAGFNVYLIKEYLTSKTCPNCNGGLANTRYVPNPRPWMCTKRPMVKCHGLLSCESEKCLESIGQSEGEEREKEDEKENVKKWWNRDLAAELPLLVSSGAASRGAQDSQDYSSQGSQDSHSLQASQGSEPDQ